MNTHYLSNVGALTNIRPSHYFISIPRTSVSYKKTEMPQNDSIIAKNKHQNSLSETNIKRIKEMSSYGDQLKEFKPYSKPSLPSERRNDHQNESKTLRHYQNLKRLMADEQRKTNYASNRWRESAGTILNTTKGETPQVVHGQRIKALIKYEKKHHEMLIKAMCKKSILILYSY